MAKKKKLISIEKNLAKELENVFKILGIPKVS